MNNQNTLRLTAPEVQIAAELLRDGRLVALPTETVYGLAANALDETAVRAVFEAKGRPQDNPLIVHVAHPEQVEALAAEIPDAARKLIDSFWPGPLTLVLCAAPYIPRIVTAGLTTVAVRCPDHPVMRAVLEACRLPLAAPSANLSGKPSPTRASHVLEDMDGRIAAVMDGGACAVGLESTVLDMTCVPPCILRPGAVSQGMLEAVLGCAVDTAHGSAQTPRSPGMKYRHYAPRASMCVLRGAPEDIGAWAAEQSDGTAVLCCDEEAALFEGLPVFTYGPMSDPSVMMSRLYAQLREADGINPRKIAATCPDGKAYDAFRDRLYRAAGGNINKL